MGEMKKPYENKFSKGIGFSRQFYVTLTFHSDIKKEIPHFRVVRFPCSLPVSCTQGLHPPRCLRAEREPSCSGEPEDALQGVKKLQTEDNFFISRYKTSLSCHSLQPHLQMVGNKSTSIYLIIMPCFLNPCSKLAVIKQNLQPLFSKVHQRSPCTRSHTVPCTGCFLDTASLRF